jgi:hypothetical protein
LLSPSSPFAIFFAIVTVVVDSLNSKTFRSVAHIYPKTKKIALPSRTYLNSTPPIVFIKFVIWVFTSLYHCFPYFICRRIVLAVSSIKSFIVTFFAFCRVCLPKMGAFYNLNLKTKCALTNPLRLSLFSIRAAFKNSPAPKFHVSHIFKSLHTVIHSCGTVSMIKGGLI